MLLLNKLGKYCIIFQKYIDAQNVSNLCFRAVAFNLTELPQNSPFVRRTAGKRWYVAQESYHQVKVQARRAQSKYFNQI